MASFMADVLGAIAWNRRTTVATVAVAYTDGANAPWAMLGGIYFYYRFCKTVIFEWRGCPLLICLRPIIFKLHELW